MKTYRDLATELVEKGKEATKGPWTSDGDQNADDVSVWGPDGEFLANIDSPERARSVPTTFDCSVQNGALIAAARDSDKLAALLLEIAEWIQRLKDDSMRGDFAAEARAHLFQLLSRLDAPVEEKKND